MSRCDEGLVNVGVEWRFWIAHVKARLMSASVRLCGCLVASSGPHHHLDLTRIVDVHAHALVARLI